MKAILQTQYYKYLGAEKSRNFFGAGLFIMPTLIFYGGGT